MRRLMLIAGIMAGVAGLGCSEGSFPTKAGSYGSYTSDGTGSDGDSEKDTGSDAGEGWVADGDSSWPTL